MKWAKFYWFYHTLYYTAYNQILHRLCGPQLTTLVITHHIHRQNTVLHYRVKITVIKSRLILDSNNEFVGIKSNGHFCVDLYIVWNKMFVSYNSWNRKSSRFESSRARSHSCWFWLRRRIVTWLQGCREWFFVEFCHSRFWFLIIKLIIQFFDCYWNDNKFTWFIITWFIIFES